MDEGCQGRGYGRRLLSEAVGFCQGAGFSELYLYTLVGLEAAIKLYQEFGFVLSHDGPKPDWQLGLEEVKYVLRLDNGQRPEKKEVST